MPTSRLASARPSAAAPHRGGIAAIIALGLVALAIGAIGAALAGLLAEPDRLDVTVDNPTPFPVSVEVRSSDGTERVTLGIASPRATRTFTRVVDHGDDWTFTFSYAGVHSEPVAVPRAAVADGAITVPDDVADRFRDAGLEPPP